MVSTGVSIGIADLPGTRWFHRWSHSASPPELAGAMEDGVTGGSLRKAQAILGGISHFEAE